jgi:hypothetical protein
MVRRRQHPNRSGVFDTTTHTSYRIMMPADQSDRERMNMF